MREERMQLERREFKLTLVSDGINGLVTLATIGFGVVLLIAGRVSLGATAAFFAAIDGFQQNYWELVVNASFIYNDLRYIRDFFEFIDSPRLDLDKGTRLPGPISRGIELDKVSFHLSRQRPAGPIRRIDRPPARRKDCTRRREWSRQDDAREDTDGPL